jgi:transketolase
MPVPIVSPDGYRFAFGKAARLREGNDVTIVANGVMVARALAAADLLAAEGISARVLNMATVSHLDRDELLAAADETGAVVTAEEHLARGGLGGAVAEFLAAECPTRMRLLGFPGFAPTGSAEWLLDHFGLNGEGIARAARELHGQA